MKKRNIIEWCTACLAGLILAVIPDIIPDPHLLSVFCYCLGAILVYILMSHE